MTDPIDIVGRLREAQFAVDSFRGDLGSAAFEDACRTARHRAFLAAPALLALLDEQAAEITSLRGALAAQVPQWLPIESAPKDGTTVILAAPDRVTAGEWHPEQWPTASEYDASTGEYLGQHETGQCIPAAWYSWDGGFTDELPPTHWMPLPAAPGASPSPADLTDAEIDDLLSLGMAPHSALVGPAEIRRFARAVMAAARSAHPAALAVPAGMALVPVEPTVAMCIAGDEARHNVDDLTRTPAIYRAMLAAAPKGQP